jgi:DNA-binding CsgD family transcriptional regulator
MVQSLLRSATSRSFRKFFGIILVAELSTVFVAWRLLDIHTNQWIKAKATLALRIARQASRKDWSLVDKIPQDRDTALGVRYEKLLSKLDDKYFPHKEGAVYLVTIEKGEEYDVTSAEAQMSDTATANQWEAEANRKGLDVYSPTPIIDDYGTYLAGYVPIVRNGKVRGLVAAEFDSSPLGDLQSVVRTAFKLSIIPAFLFSLIVACILALRFVEPTDVLRTIADTARDEKVRALTGAADEPWNSLTDKELEVAELAGDGLTNKEIAQKLFVGTEAIKTRLKNIKAKTGLSKVQLGLKVQARRLRTQRSSLLNHRRRSQRYLPSRLGLIA